MFCLRLKASKAIDLLLESKWAKDDKRQKEPVFTSRESVVDFMDQMLRHKFFHRAKTVIVKKDKKKKLEEESSANEEVLKDKKNKAKKDSEKLSIKEEQHKDKEEKGDKTEKSQETETKKKEKKKIKLDMHLEQIFVDENEVVINILSIYLCDN